MTLDLVDLLPAAVSGVVAGLVAWGGMRAELRNLRESVTNLSSRVDALMLLLAEHGLLRRSDVHPKRPPVRV